MKFWQRSKRRKSAQNNLNYETLHQRELMAADISFGGNWVAIQGTNGNDQAVVSPIAGGFRATVNGISKSFSNSRFNRIYFYAYSGNDSFVNNTAVTSYAYGYSGADVFYGGSGTDYIYGHSGADRLYGRGGNDLVVGGSHNDLIQGGSGHDDLRGESGNDTVYGESGNDKIYGQDGHDRLNGGRGSDTILGGNHNDYIDGFFENDSLYGGAGNDIVIGGAGNDLVAGQDGNDRLYGHSGHDWLYGGNHNDDIFGGSGTDYLNGGHGLDGLFGGIGSRDTLDGGPGADRLLHSGYRSNGQSYTQEAFTNVQANDAHILLMNGGKNWTDAEVEKIDRGFEAMHVSTGSTRLLKDSVVGRGPLEFYRAPGSQVAVNYRATHRVVCYDGTFNHGNAFAAQTAIHEIAHNWDEASESGSYATTFWAQSGWRTTAGYGMSAGQMNGNNSGWYYRSNTTDFARSYGRFNPYEDFATTFASYFMRRGGLPYQGTGQGAFYAFNNGTTNYMPVKTQIVHNLVSYLT